VFLRRKFPPTKVWRYKLAILESNS
jgi:hypothetical protein